MIYYMFFNAFLLLNKDKIFIELFIAFSLINMSEDSSPNSCKIIENNYQHSLPDSSNLFRSQSLHLSSDDDEFEFKFEDFLSKSRPKPRNFMKSSPTVIIVDDSDTDEECSWALEDKTKAKRLNKSKSQSQSDISQLDGSNPGCSKSGSRTVDEITQQLTAIDLTESKDSNDSEVDSEGEVEPSSFTPTHLLQTPLLSNNPNDPITPNPITPNFKNLSKKDKKFNSTREALANKWYYFFNETVFESLLPIDLNIQWNKNLTKTAGYCEYRFTSISGLANRTISINLSTKIITNEERLKSTLIHELCHAATWIINGVKEGHGSIWRGWAEKAGRLVPGLPPITRCHTYSIDTKFKYKCVNCYYIVGRHSKSIDTTRQCCPLCRSRLELVPLTNKDGTPRKLNQFAAFVKDNYNSIEKTMTHSEKMKFLSTQYSKTK